MIRLFKKKKKEKPPKGASRVGAAIQTVEPGEYAPIEVSNLQGLGMREQQQDSFGLSKLEEYEDKGLLAVLCDGMGGMAEGAQISGLTVTGCLQSFPWEDPDQAPSVIQEITSDIYRRYLGRGGTTLVLVFIREGQLRFFSVGDSDLFLLREGELYSLNERHEYSHTLLRRAMEDLVSVDYAFDNTQAGALDSYVGMETVRIDSVKSPFPLLPEDTLLICSDGISDVLSLQELSEAMRLEPAACCEQLEIGVQAAGGPNQDNYTAIVIRYHGGKENHQDEEIETIN